MPKPHEWGARTTYSMVVRLNVYDLGQANSMLHPLGFGLYHTGVEVNGSEYTFSAVGVFSHPPKAVEMQNEQVVYRESLHLGEFTKGVSALQDIVQKLKKEFQGDGYHYIIRNCNHFSERLTAELFPEDSSKIPYYINRAAWYGSLMPCFWGFENEPTSFASDVNRRNINQRFPGQGQVLTNTTARKHQLDVSNNEQNGEEMRKRMTEMRRARLKYLSKEQNES